MDYPCAMFSNFSLSRFGFIKSDFYVKNHRLIHWSTSVCDFVFVCSHDKTKTAETKIDKLGLGIVHDD